MKVGTLEIELLANMARLQADMNTAKSHVTGAMNSIEGAVSMAKTAFIGLAGAVTVGAFVSLVKGAIDGAAALNDLSIMTGATVEALSGLAQVGALSDVSVTTIAGSMNKLARNMAGTTEESKGTGLALKALNINFNEFKSMAPEQQMLTVAKAMDGFASGTGKSAIAMALYGKEGAKMLPFMADLATAGELHAVVTGKQAAQSDAFADNLTRLKLSSAAFKTELVMGILPALDVGLQSFIDVTNGTGGLRDEIRKLAADGTLAEWTRGAITGLTYVADAVQIVIRAIKMAGESIGAYAAAGVSYFGGIAAALKLVMTGDFAGAVGAMKSGMDQSKSIINDLGGSVVAAFGEQTFGSKIRARMTELGAMGEVAKETKKKLDFTNVLEKNAKSARETKDPMDALLKTIQNQTALFQAEMDGQNKLTTGQHMYVKVTTELAAGVHKLDAAEKRRVVTALDLMRATEQLMIQQEARTKMLHEAAAEEQKAVQTYEKTVTALYDQTAALAEEVLVMGLSVEQQRELAQQRTAILLLTKQQELASVQAADAESGTMSRRAIAMQEEIRLIQARESLLNVKLEQEQTINNFKSAWASVDQTAHDVFVNIFQGGQDVFSKLTNVLKSTLLDLLYQMTVKKWLFNITAAVTGTSAGMANAAMGAATGGGGGAGSLLSSLGSLTGGTGLLGAAGLGLQSGFGALMSGGLAGVGAAVQGGLAAIGTGMGASVAAGLGTIAGALGPIALGIGVAYKLLSGKKDSRFGSAYNYTPDSGTQIVGGPNQGVDYAGQSSSINSVAAAINAVLTKVGSGDRLAQLGAGFESSVKGKGFSYAGGSLTSGASFGQQDVYNNRGNKSIEQAMAEYQTELKQATLQALQAASGVPRVIAEKLYSVNLDALGDQALSGLIAAIDAQIAQVDGFRAAVVSLPFENLKNLSFDAAAGLIAAAGGFESLSTKLTSYMDNYYSAEEKRLRTITQINAATAGSGLNAATATRQSFRMLVEAQDLTTTHGQANYAALLNVADAFAALTPVLEKVNDGRQALINSYEAEASALKSTIDRFKDFAQSLRSFRDGLLTGGMSPLTPEQRYAAAGSQFDKIMLGTQTGTQAEREVALGQLQGAASTLLEASKTRNASGAEYITDFLRVQEALSGAAIGALATVDVAQLQLGVATSQLAALNQINDTLQGNGRTTSGEGFFRTQDPSTVGSIRKDDSMVTALLLKVEELTGEVRALREQQSHETLEQINATYGAASTGASALASAQSKAAWSQPAALV